ncbi:scavenger receptor class F member 1-like [Haliotis rufescens]|uniref:scavenger receptor class F member 1-like n=1 Tax=Haliotis rufescens TaxID=6454 RepID=UPI00201F7389|nr:scavenger receptor class F member 1-like [Haliotis rufescens]
MCSSVCSDASTSCKETYHCSDCDRESGDCVTECDPGYYGRKCNSTCSKNCRNNTCVISSYGSGNCTDGCVPGYQDASCNIPCDSPGGNCTACPGGCDGGYCQLGSSCVSGCVDSYYGTGCDGATVGLAAGVSGAAISFLVMVFVVLCCKYCQRFRQKSVTQTEDVVCDSVDDMDGEPVVELEWYSETPLKDMATPCGSPDGNCGSGGAAGGGADDVYDVADVGRRELAAVFDNIYSKISRA